MFAPRRHPVSTAARALLASLALSGPAAAAPKAEIVDRLETWLDANTDLPRAPETAVVRIVDPTQIPPPGKTAMAIGKQTRGLYDPVTSTIFLVRPWNPAIPEDVSVLLHEMVHQRLSNRHSYCAAAQEYTAYKLQETWLNENGGKLDVNWIAVILASSCAPRDVHPD